MNHLSSALHPHTGDWTPGVLALSHTLNFSTVWAWPQTMVFLPQPSKCWEYRCNQYPCCGFDLSCSSFVDSWADSLMHLQVHVLLRRELGLKRWSGHSDLERCLPVPSSSLCLCFLAATGLVWQLSSAKLLYFCLGAGNHRLTPLKLWAEIKLPALCCRCQESGTPARPSFSHGSKL